MSSKKIPNMVVEPPGTRSLEWLRRDEAVLSPYNRPFYYPLVVEGGEGAVVRGVDGNEYIDLMHACKCARAYFTFKKESSVSVKKTHARFELKAKKPAVFVVCMFSCLREAPVRESNNII